MYKNKLLIHIIGFLLFCNVYSLCIAQQGDQNDQIFYQNSEPLLIVNAQIVDVETMQVRTGALLIKEGKIMKELTSKPKNYKGDILNAKGKWVVPGLYDMHVHSSSNKSVQFKDMPPLKTENSAKVMLYAGVTGFLNLFGEENYLFNLRKQQREGNFLGAEIYAAGPILTSPNGHGTQFNTETRTVSSPNQAKSVVKSLAKKDPDVVKLVYNPSRVKERSMTSMDKATMQSVIEKSNELGLKTVVHFGSWQDAYEAVDAGASAITHIRPQSVPDSLISLMKKKNTKWIPTLSVYTEAFHYMLNAEAFENSLLREVTNSTLRSSYRDNFPAKAKKFAERKAPEIKKKLLNNLQLLHNEDISILAGTDAGNIGVFQGYTLHRELELYVESGMSPWEALRTATINPGEFLGINTGIKSGDRANLLILNKSPVNNIQNTKDIYKIVFQGQVIDRKDLLKVTKLSEG